ncbi:MAG: T9SS C-terminal target domain-containing protein, partial [Flavobacteriales bacterium TMED84]
YTGEYTKEIDLVKYTKGIYFLEITTENGVIYKKMIMI